MNGLVLCELRNDYLNSFFSDFLSLPSLNVTIKKQQIKMKNQHEYSKANKQNGIALTL